MNRKIGKWSIWIGKVPFFYWYPKTSYFNGKYYEKYAITLFNRMIEFSSTMNFETITEYDTIHIREGELDQIIKEYEDKFDERYRDRYYD